VLGGGYTGLSAALTLAEAGGDVVLLDANPPGWGASGRNGGMVSPGSALMADAQIVRRFGAEDARIFFNAERAAIDMVEDRLDRHGLEVDRQSRGYTYVAHSPRVVSKLVEQGREFAARYGISFEFVGKEDMAAQGLNSPDFHAAAHYPLGFALNPMKFVLGLARAARAAGVRLHYGTPVKRIERAGGYALLTPGGRVLARKLLVATNGYSSDDLPRALASRYLPIQSNILVSRPLTTDEIAAQGWWSEQMVCDTRKLLHYFRLMPNGRVLFGLRGEARATEAGMERTRARARADFERIFPAWRHVETPYFWSGFVCMTRDLAPFAGALDGMEDAWGAFGYHGSGVAMAPYSGALIADLALGRARLPHPALMRRRPPRFELGRWRRAPLPLIFGWYGLEDRL